MSGYGVRDLTGYRSRVESSMLWAAWADAVGFISELTDDAGLRRRTGGTPLSNTIAWRRRVGGQYGVTADLPAGAYSDDTQLRLAVARSINDQGFDVETFARIELPLWPAYALGGGRASRAAATGMAKANATWCTNFYDGWTAAGGNGVAMRIQPHVWAGALDDRYVVPVLHDAIVTHGHPRALVGAVLHAVALAFALREGKPAAVTDWGALLGATRSAARFFFTDDALADIWVPSWERTTGSLFANEWQDTVDECERLLDHAALFVAATRTGREPAVAYRHMVDLMGLTAKRTLGSGTGTVVAAMALAAAFPKSPLEAVLLSATAVGTDTDTIATITAATIAAAHPHELPGPVQDEEYLRAEAERLSDIAFHVPTPAFAYPDTLHWRPPQSQLDVVGLADGRLALAGIAWLEPAGPRFSARDTAWTWMRSDFGMSFLVKHRHDLRELPPGNWPRRRESQRGITEPLSRPPVLRQDAEIYADAPALFDFDVHPLISPQHELAGAAMTDRSPTASLLDAVLEDLRRDGVSDVAIGRAVRRVALDGDLADLTVLADSIRSHLRAAGDREAKD